MNYYLLQSFDTDDYILISRKDNTERYYNKGRWTMYPPHTETEFSRYYTSPYEGYNWWLPRYSDYINARLIYRCKSLDSYKKWLSKHPEYLI